MSTNMRRLTCALSAVAFLTPVATASAQWGYPAYAISNPCACVQPVAQSCYQTVPVTEYQQVRQVVKRPVIETKYVEQEVTAYRQVLEPRTVNIPTISYQNVTELQTQQVNMGHWRTRFQSNPRMTPCQYDARPDLFWFLNRTGYAIRSAFTPAYIARHEYVSQVALQTVPVTRRVAIQGTRQATYNLAKLVPHTTTRKVAVNTVKYVDQEVVAMKPVTVMRTVPIGTRTAFLYSPSTTIGPQTALRPMPDPISNAKSNKNSPERISNSTDKFDRNGDAFAPKREAKNDNSTMVIPLRESSLGAPIRPDKSRLESRKGHQSVARHFISGSAPSFVRVSGWRARRKTTDGPLLTQPAISVAGN